MKTAVSIAQTPTPEYPKTTPFHPSEPYPEYPFRHCLAREENHTYRAVRESLRLLKLDEANYDTPHWNPLQQIIKPGNTVVIKPNWVRSRHFGGGDVWSVITHPSVIRATLDYVWIALQGQGKIIIADAPQYDCNFAELLEISGIKPLQTFFNQLRGSVVEVRDLRRYWSPRRHFPSMRKRLAGDPLGTQIVNLGPASAVYGVNNIDRVYGAVYHRQETASHHTGETQEYSLSRTILSADTIICLPKLKVHKKVGVTLNMKNFVGATTNTNFHTHHLLGSPSEGGDQYPENVYSPTERNLIHWERRMYDTFLAKQSLFLEYIHRSLYWLHGTFLKPFGWTVRKSQRVFDAGAWHGNNMAWRFVVDLSRIVTFADQHGKLHTTPQRNIFSIIDGIIAGEGKGPLEPDPRHVGLIISGENMIATDLVATRLMGFDYKKLKIFTNILNQQTFSFNIDNPANIPIYTENEKFRTCLHKSTDPLLNFTPHPGWLQHMEIDEPIFADHCVIAHSNRTTPHRTLQQKPVNS
jgi:uncharacterized protein (DUF362 family)